MAIKTDPNAPDIHEAIRNHFTFEQQDYVKRTTKENGGKPIPPYVHKDFPKMKHHESKHGSSVLVYNPEQELALGADWGDVPAPKPPVLTPADEMELLKKRLAELESKKK